MKLPIEGIVDTGLKIIDKIIPDPVEKERAKLALYEAQRSGDLEEMRTSQAPLLAQIDVNKIEAASGSLFIGGWRPGVGWVCVAAIAWHFVLVDFLTFALNALGIDAPAMPSLDIQELLGLITAMLGIGYYRTREKIEGVAAR